MSQREEMDASGSEGDRASPSTDGGPRVALGQLQADGDLRGNFLAAVGNTISHKAPLGSPTINPDEMSSSSDSGPETPCLIPQRNRRMSAITRAEHAALSLSKPPLPSTSTSETVAATRGASSENLGQQKQPVRAAMTRVPGDKFGELDWRRYLTSSPAYPGGVGGRLTCTKLLETPPSGKEGMKRSYKAVFGDTLGDSDESPKETKKRNQTTRLRRLEAAREEGEDCLRVRTTGNTTGSSQTLARIVEVQLGDGKAGGVTSTQEALYSVVLDGYEASDNSGGEVMAVRVSVHPTLVAAPREVQAIALLPDAIDAQDQIESHESVPVWTSGEVAGSDGLWHAAAQGRIRGGAVELRNKAAVWSAEAQSFELDLLEAWRPGGLEQGSWSPSHKTPPAPETVQMVCTSALTKAADGSATVGSARGGISTRLPTMQLVRTTVAPTTLPVDNDRRDIDGIEGDAKVRNDRGSMMTTADRNSALGPGSGIGEAADGEMAWIVAVAWPMSVLQAFALAVIGLETSLIGASVSLVDRVSASAELEQQAAIGFVGFEQAVRQSPRGSADGNSKVSRRKGEAPLLSATSTGSARSAPSRSDAAASSRRMSAASVMGKESRQNARGDDPASSAGVRYVFGDGQGGECGRGPERRNSDGTEGSGQEGFPARGLERAVASRDFVSQGQVNDNRHDASSGRSMATFQNFSPDETNEPGGGVDGSGVFGSNVDNGRGHDAGHVNETSTVAVPVKRRLSVQAVAAEVVDKVYRNTYVCNLCLLTLVISFLADLYPGAPSHNAPLAAALLWTSCNVDAVRSLRRRSFAYALSMVILVSLFIDFDFLTSDLEAYALEELEEQDDSLPGVIMANDMQVFGRITVGVAALLKALSWQSLLATSPQGVHALNLLWRRFKLFLPIWGSPRKLTKEVYNRIVALAWVHLLSGVALAAMAGVAGLDFVWAPQFASAEGAGIPVTVICFAKGVTNLLVSATLFRNMDLALCLNVFGCLACFQGWHRAREARRHTRHGVTYPKVILEWDYIMICGYIKIFDLLVGFWLWIGLGWAWSADRDYSDRHSIRMLLLSITTVHTLTDVWCVFLGITVALLVSQYLLRKEKSRGNARNAFGGDGDVEIGRSLATGGLLSVSPDSSVYETGRNRPGGGRARVFSSDENDNGTSSGGELERDDESYSTGTSETEQEASDSDDNETAAPGGSATSVPELRFDRKISMCETASNASSRGAAGESKVVEDRAMARRGVGDDNVGGAGDIATFVRPRRRSVFAPGGNRLVYKRAFSTRSSSDDSVLEVINDGNPPLPTAVTLDKSFATSGEDFMMAWGSLPTRASFRCRIGIMPDEETVASHLSAQGFFVVASGIVSDHTKIYACARGVEVSNIFFAELVFEKAMHELAFTFKCRDERLISLFVCHLHLRRIIDDHQPVA